MILRISEVIIALSVFAPRLEGREIWEGGNRRIINNSEVRLQSMM